jgi:hypothetical protein
VKDWRDGQTRYMVHFAEGGAGMRWFHVPLEKGRVIVEGDREYVVLSVEPPKNPEGLGFAEVELA